MKIRVLTLFYFLFFSQFSNAAVLGKFDGDKTVINYKGGLGVLVNGREDTVPFSDLTKNQQQQALNAIVKEVKSNVYASKDDPKYPDNIYKFKSARLVALILAIGFLLNIPFFIFWSKKRKADKEVLLYNVTGKLTYFTVLDWISRLEIKHDVRLASERAQIEKLYLRAKKVKRPLRIYTNQVYDILMEKAFGKKMIRTAFNRMHTYSKIVFIWDVAVYLSIVYATICYFSIDSAWAGAVIIGVLIGNIIAAPCWLLLHLTFNNSFKYILKNEIKKGKGVGMRIIMAQFYGAFAGYVWKDLYFVKGTSSWLVGPEYVGWGYGFSGGGFNSGFDGFGGGDFGGGGAGGDW